MVSFRERASILEKENFGNRGLVWFASLPCGMECFFLLFAFLLRMGLIWWLVGSLVGWLVDWLFGCLVGWLVGDNIGLFRWWKAREEGAAAGDGGAGDGNCFLLRG